MSTHPKISPIRAFALGTLLTTPSLVSAAAVAGNFEARLSTGVLVQVVVGSPASDLSRAFSGKVISEGVAQPIKGTLKTATSSSDSSANPSELSATISGLKEVAPIVLTYTPASTQAASAESLSVVYSSTGSTPATAFPAFQASAGQTSINSVHAVAYRLDGAQVTQESINTAISDTASQIADILDESDKNNPTGSLTTTKAAIKSATDALALAKTAKDKKTAALRTAKLPFSAYFSAYDTATKAAADLTTAQTSAVKSISEKLVKETALNVDSTTATSTAQGLIDVVTTSIATLPLVADTTMGVKDADVTAAKNAFKEAITKPNSKSTALGIDGISPWETEFNNSVQTVGLDLISNLFVDPEYPIASKKAFYTALSTILTAYFDKAYASSLADAKLSALHPTADLSTVDNAQTELDAALAEITMQQNAFDEATLQKIALEAELAALKSRKTLLQANLKLLGFLGYGNATISVTGNATNTKAATTPALVVFAGVTPDGQKWTYSSSLRLDPANQSETSGAVYVNAIAGKSPILAHYSVFIPEALDTSAPADSSTPTQKLALTASTRENGLSWSHLACTNVGPATLPARSSSHNLFLDAAAENPTADTNVLVAFGETTPGDIHGFGAVIQNTPDKTQNLVKRLLAAKSGTTLTLTAPTNPTDKSLPSFAGKYAYSGSTPTAFSGLLLQGDDTASVIQGYGSLTIDATHTLPVSISVPTATGDTPPPTAPTLSDVVAWKGMKGSVLEFTNPGPATTSLNLNTATLIDSKGKTVATGELNSSGRYSFNTAAIGSGTYTVKIDREYVSGLYSATSAPFQITQKVVPANTYQMLLSYNQFTDTASDTRWSILSSLSNATGSNLQAEGSPLTWTYADHNFAALPDGNPYRARLTVTTTSTGSFTGKLELIELRSVTDELGAAAPSNSTNPELFPVTADYSPKVPVLNALTIKGELVSHAFANPGHPECLFSSIQIPSSTAPGATAYPLSFAIIDDPLENPLDPAAVKDTKVPMLFSSLRTVPWSVATEEPVLLIGKSVPTITTAPKAAKGKYTATGSGLAVDRMGSTFTWDYSAGGATIGYTVNGFTGSANVGLDGEIAMMIAPQKITSSKINKSTGGVSQLVQNLYGFMEAGLESNEGVFSVKGHSLHFVTGSELESDPKKSNGYRYNTGWDAAAFRTANNGESLGAKAMAQAMTDAYQPVALISNQVVSADEYTLTLVTNNGSESAPYTVSFATKTAGAELAVGELSTEAKAIVKGLNSTNATGSFSCKVQLPRKSVSVTMPGVYVRDETDAELVARGASTDGEVIWKLTKATTPNP